MVDYQLPTSSHRRRLAHSLPFLRVDAYHLLQSSSHPACQAAAQILKEKLNGLQSTDFEYIWLICKNLQKKRENVLADSQNGVVVVEADIDFGGWGYAAGVGICPVVCLEFGP